jgi:ketosteroid isomerase-like protein
VAARGSLDGLLASLGANVVYQRAGAPIAFGLTSTHRLLGGNPDPPGTRVSWQPLGGGVSDDLRAAYTFGVTVRAGASSPPQLERYIAFWAREARGPWRIIAYSEVNGLASTHERSKTSDEDSVAAAGLTRGSTGRPDDETRIEVRAADSSFSDLSYRMGAAFAFSNTAAADAVVFGDPQLVVGPRAIDEYLEARAGQSSLVWQPVLAWVAGSRDLGFTVGESTSTGRGSSGAAVQRSGKYLTVWKRQPDGTWKFVVDGGNRSPSRADER